MKKPYIKLYTNIAGFNVYFVDGEYIRTNLNEEFTNFGQHFRFKFIPKNEFWIDFEHSPGEAEFYIDHLLIENYLMKKGYSYNKALGIADIKEEKERKKSVYYKKKIQNKTKKQELENIHKKLLKEVNGFKIWLIDGELVRDLYYIDFTEGGHDKVYNFVPKNEIWLDNDLSKKELKFVLLHEAHERKLMKKGYNYNKAHRSSSKIEYYCRHNPSKLNSFLKKELS